MFQSIASCWPLLCWNRKGKKNTLCNCDRNACREGSFTRPARVNMADDNNNNNKTRSCIALIAVLSALQS